ncbi:hypothetical protein EV421DRAFT_1917704 [Armillaria borealis]|uniref:Uncharacterized protein n=1 Tax=Armillaria borealis TaxID=47425 RepID=A0AA39IEB3_9AGAR|nr:hypothetical protein EV421DRAFT_1917704 [Armillaria borealis]
MEESPVAGQPLLATSRSFPSLPLLTSCSTLDLNTEGVDDGNMLGDHEVTADYTQGMRLCGHPGRVVCARGW